MNDKTELERLIAERDPKLEDLRRERDPDPEFYTPLGVLLEDQIRGLVSEYRERREHAS